MITALLTRVPATMDAALTLSRGQREQLAASFAAYHAEHHTAQVVAAGRVVRALALTDDDGPVQAARADLWCALRPLGVEVATAVADALLVELAGHLMTAQEQALFATPWWTVTAHLTETGVPA